VSRALPFNVPFREAEKSLLRKVTLSPAESAALGDWAKVYGYTVATVTKAELLQDLLDATRLAMQEGLTFADFQASLGDIMEARGWEGLEPFHAETVFRTPIQSAYGSGRLQQQRDQQEEFPFLQLHEIIDSRTRPTHRAANRTVQPIGSLYWRTHYPPWGFNCRGHCESLTTAEARAFGISPVNVLGGENDERFTSPGLTDVYRPDLSRFEPELRRKVDSALSIYDPSAVED
jgi:SPP1 gp7 family putative phage head morphogenesis protein